MTFQCMFYIKSAINYLCPGSEHSDSLVWNPTKPSITQLLKDLNFNHIYEN